MILDKLADSAKNRVALKKAEIPAEVLRDRAEALSVSEEFAFKNALKQEGMSFICEVKKASIYGKRRISKRYIRGCEPAYSEKRLCS